MTGGFTESIGLGGRQLRELGRISPKPVTKVWNEAARISDKTEEQIKRDRRKIGLRSAQKYDTPSPLAPDKPDPVPTYIEIEPTKKRKKTGRGATILADRMNRRRQILNTKSGGSILR